MAIKLKNQNLNHVVRSQSQCFDQYVMLPPEYNCYFRKMGVDVNHHHVVRSLELF